MLSTILGAIASTISGMILFLMQHYMKKKDNKDEKNEKEQHEKDILLIKSINALGKLAMSNTSVLKSAETEGEAKDAYNEYKKVNGEMMNYLIQNLDTKG